jgi:predicted unusual protein kinase regulating ubiquinone biosynthesis (AarF/ABC1/UbiB family)
MLIIFHVLCFYLCHFPVVWFWVLTVFPVTKIVNACFFGSLTVLEGIALSTDPNYKVLSSSYPWIARKVLTDKSPQLQSTLRSLLYKAITITPHLFHTVNCSLNVWLEK